MMHTARKDQRLFGQLLFYADRGETLCAKMRLRCGCAASPRFSLNL